MGYKNRVDESILSAARNMTSKGLSPELIMEITGLSAEAIEAL